MVQTPSADDYAADRAIEGLLSGANTASLFCCLGKAMPSIDSYLEDPTNKKPADLQAVGLGQRVHIVRLDEAPLSAPQVLLNKKGINPII